MFFSSAGFSYRNAPIVGHQAEPGNGPKKRGDAVTTDD